MSGYCEPVSVICSTLLKTHIKKYTPLKYHTLGAKEMSLTGTYFVWNCSH